MNTSEKIKAYRLKNAWSQEQLAQLASLSVRTVQRIEKGHTPGLETISALASVFNVTVSELSDEAELANDALDTSAFSMPGVVYWKRLASIAP